MSRAAKQPYGRLALFALAVAIGHEAVATEFELGDTAKLELKTEIASGIRVRMQKPANGLLGKLNVPGQQHLCDNDACSGVAGNQMFLDAPGNVSQDYDNGDLSYGKYQVSQAITRFSQRMSFTYGDYGLFARGIYYYDPINAGFNQQHPDTTFQPAKTRRGSDAVGDIGRRFQLMEAYAYGDLPLWNDNVVNVRLGNQIMYWGESNFLVLNSLNSINPPDANRVEFAGSNIDEYFTPVPMLLLRSKFGALDVQTFYQFGFEPVQVETAGSYFSTDDTTGSGAAFAHLDGKAHEDPMNQVRPYAPLSNSGRTIYRLPDRKPDGNGQFGAAFKYFLPDLGEGTTFGLYMANYHNRIPVGSFIAAQASACRNAPAALDGTPAVASYCLGLEKNPPGGEPVPVDTAHYFLEYPKDVQMYGITGVTTKGTLSFQFEYAYRPNLPVQVDPVDLVYAAEQPALPRQDVNLGVVTVPGARHGAPDYVETLYRHHTVQPGQYIRGYERMQVGQLNLSAILLTPNNPFGASQMLFVTEFGLTHVFNMPGLDQIQFDGPGTSNHHSAGIDGTGANGQSDPNRLNFTQQVRGFATAVSYGYRLYSELEYPDALLGLLLKPTFAVAHDVGGTAVGNGGNFISGRKQFDLGLIVKAPTVWTAQFGYTWYLGAGDFNLVRDRDNLQFSVILNF